MHQTSIRWRVQLQIHYEKAQAGAASDSSWHFSSLWHLPGFLPPSHTPSKTWEKGWAIWIYNSQMLKATKGLNLRESGHSLLLCSWGSAIQSQYGRVWIIAVNHIGFLNIQEFKGKKNKVTFSPQPSRAGFVTGASTRGTQPLEVRGSPANPFQTDGGKTKNKIKE